MGNRFWNTISSVSFSLALCAVGISCSGEGPTVNGTGGQSGSGIAGSGPVAGASGAAPYDPYNAPGSGGAAGAAGMAGAAGAAGTNPLAGAGTGAEAGGIQEPMDGGTADDGGSSIIQPTAGSGGGTTTQPPAGPGCLQGSGDYLARGPYGVSRMDVTIGAQGPYTIFYPDPLDANCPHPIVAWGNGTTVTGPDVYAFYNEHAASWGIVVVASHNSNVGSGEFHRAGLDYLIAENANSGSIFFNKLSTRAGTSGHSQGGMGANAGANHPNVETIVNVQGAFGSAPAGKDFLCLTGTADLNPSGCKSSVDGASAPAMHANWQGGDHTGTATVAGFISGDPGTVQYMRLYSAWFRCHLGDDNTACAMFQGGTGCPVCQEPGWAEIYSRNF